MKFSVEHLEIYLLILVRISAFVFAAPFFSLSSIPRKVKVGISVFIAILVFQTLAYQNVTYNGEIGYAGLILKEVIVGLLIGYFANICSSILTFSGHMIDMEIGFSMVQLFDPVAKVQATITGNFYSYLVMLMMLVSNLHHYLLLAIIDSFNIIPIASANIPPNLYLVMLKFLADFFIIGFRIVLPVFASILLLNSVLAILAKVAPQMNMFVIGMQLKVYMGLFIIFLIIGLLPSVSDFIMDEVKIMVELIIKNIS